MPMSNPWHLAPVLHFVGALNPKRILDVGVGLGTYGFMIRQHIDISQERIDKAEWTLQIDGVEIFEAYRNPIWDYYYDQIFIADVREIKTSLHTYDVILCNDVLEHFPLAEAQLLVRQLLTIAPVVIATSPNIDWPQGAWGNNEAETHQCLFRASDMPNLVMSMPTGPTSLFIATEDPTLIALIRDAAIGCPIPHVAKIRTLIQRACRKIRRMIHSQ